MEMNDLFATPAVIAVLISTVTLVAVFLVANGISAWYEERTRRAGAAVRKDGQLPSGFGTFRGVAQNLDARSGGELVRRERVEVSAQGANGSFWRAVSSTTTGRMFVLVLDSGAEIEIDAGEARLVGFAETTPGAYTTGPGEAPRRAMIARVSAGDEVWATGVLARPAADGAGGAYRSNVSRRKLRAPRRGELELSHESPVARWATLGAAHKRGAFGALAALALLHLLAFRKADQLLLTRSSVFDDGALWTLHNVQLLIEGAAALGVLAVVVLWMVSVRSAKAQHRT